MIEHVYLGHNLVLSAKIPYRAFCEGFFVSSVTKNVSKSLFRGLLTCTWRFIHLVAEKKNATIEYDTVRQE